MAKTITRDFSHADRYLYDFKYCTASDGWAQLDTSQDASYFGQWINPFKRQIFCYCEGDLILTKLDTVEEIAAEVAEIKSWNESQGHRFIGIDPGFNADLKSELAAVGLEGYLY